MNHFRLSSGHMALVTAIAIVGLSGCIEGADAPLLIVGGPRLGESALYEGSDGSTLAARVVEVASRENRWLHPSESIVLEYRYTPPGHSGQGYVFREAIDGNGLIVQHMASCGSPMLGENGAIECYDARRAIFWHDAGWPGAMGAAPFWFEHETNRAWDVRTVGNGGIARLSATISDRGNGCSLVSYDGPPSSPEGIPVTVGLGVTVVCPGQAFPTQFESSISWAKHVSSSGPTQFIRSHHLEGDTARLRKPPILPAVEINSDLEFREFEGRLYQNPEPDQLPLTTREAMAEARSGNADVERFWNRFPDLFAIASIYSKTGESGGGILLGGSDTSHERALILGDGSGPCLSVIVEKTVHNASARPNDTDRIGYDVLEASPCNMSVITVDGIARQQVMFPAAAALGEKLVGHVVSDGRLGFTHYLRPTFWSVMENRWKQDGYMIEVSFEDPDAKPIGPGLVASLPYEMYVDGPTGGLIYITAPPSKFPW